MPDPATGHDCGPPGHECPDGHEHHHHHKEHRHGPRGFFAPHGDGPAEGAMMALMMTAKMIHRFRETRISQNKQFSKLSGPRMGVLFVVHHSGGIRMGDLAAKLRVAPRTVTDLVDGLEHDGFLHRVPDPRDRRASILELSAQAKKDFDHMVKMRSAFVEEIFSPLSNDEKNTLVVLLNKLCDGPIRDLLADELGKFDKP
jgi:DNA-binding MarR family transcriptional regulator